MYGLTWGGRVLYKPNKPEITTFSNELNYILKDNWLVQLTIFMLLRQSLFYWTVYAQANHHNYYGRDTYAKEFDVVTIAEIERKLTEDHFYRKRSISSFDVVFLNLQL